MLGKLRNIIQKDTKPATLVSIIPSVDIINNVCHNAFNSVSTTIVNGEVLAS